MKFAILIGLDDEKGAVVTVGGQHINRYNMDAAAAKHVANILDDRVTVFIQFYIDRISFTAIEADSDSQVSVGHGGP